MEPKVVTIIQARMNSSRLPGKVLLPLGPDNKSVLWWMLTRAKTVKLVNEAIIATVLNDSNQPIRETSPVQTFSWAGDENDVMGRVLWAAEQTYADIIVDLTGDCPMIDPNHIDFLIERLIKSEVDYVSNDIIDRSWPDGLDCQVYWTKTLQKCKKIFNPQQHCGWNIPQHPEIFKIKHYLAPKDMHWPELGLTLDTPEDYKLLKFIFNKFGHDLNFHVEDVIKFLKENPKYITNSNVKRKTPEEG